MNFKTYFFGLLGIYISMLGILMCVNFTEPIESTGGKVILACFALLPGIIGILIATQITKDAIRERFAVIDENKQSYKDMIEEELKFLYYGIHRHTRKHRFLLIGSASYGILGNFGKITSIPIESLALYTSNVLPGDECTLVYSEKGDLTLKKVSDVKKLTIEKMVEQKTEFFYRGLGRRGEVTESIPLEMLAHLLFYSITKEGADEKVTQSQEGRIDASLVMMGDKCILEKNEKGFVIKKIEA
jgi:hypothetical protein